MTLGGLILLQACQVLTVALVSLLLQGVITSGTAGEQAARSPAAAPLEVAPEVGERIAGVYSVSVAAVYRVVEAAAGVVVAAEAERVRVALIELERLFNHLDVTMKLCDDASLSVGFQSVAPTVSTRRPRGTTHSASSSTWCCGPGGRCTGTDPSLPRANSPPFAGPGVDR